MKVQSIDFGALITKLKMNLIKMQEYLEEQEFILIPKLIDCIQTLIPCRSQVFSNIECTKCQICLQKEF